MPHTVQIYSLDDPAPTYGNKNFSEILSFMHTERKYRPVLWYPETAYWVSHDIDVPLFLPVYAHRRLHDLRLIAIKEDQSRAPPIQGQVVFSSGWEWGYWLNDIVAMRSAFELPPHDWSLNRAFRHQLRPLRGLFGEHFANWAEQLAEYSNEQHQVLILGKTDDPRLPTHTHKRHGQAYLQGWESWDEVAEFLVPWVRHQPSRLSLLPRRFEWDTDYKTVAPLLSYMAETLDRLAEAFKQLPPNSAPAAKEIIDGTKITALRAQFVESLYKATYLKSKESRKGSRRILQSAQKIAHQRPFRYPDSRVASWTPNGTSYRYQYLWTSRNLWYWHRDLEQVDKWWTAGQPTYFFLPGDLCHRNIVDLLGEVWGNPPRSWKSVLTSLALGRECVQVPKAEPQVPKSLP